MFTIILPGLSSKIPDSEIIQPGSNDGIFPKERFSDSDLLTENGNK